MEGLDPGLITAVLAAMAAAFATWQASRKDAVSVLESSEVRREELLTRGLEVHFRRLEAQVAEANERIDVLSKRVSELEAERISMIAWMAVNGVPWPPTDNDSK